MYDNQLNLQTCRAKDFEEGGKGDSRVKENMVRRRDA